VFQGLQNLVAVCFLIPVLAIRFLWLRFTSQVTRQTERPCLAFFHPYCNDGGGGEVSFVERIVLSKKFHGNDHKRKTLV
jgi:hypothetical protein